MKKLLALMLALAALLSLAACGQTAKPSETTANPTETTNVQSHYPATVTDHAGREVVIEKEPRRLVSGYYISTSLLIALDLDEKLVGIEAKADKRAIYKLSAPDLIALPNVGTAKEFDLEGCAALQPDLVILPIKLKSAVETLEGLGIDVLLVNPESQDLLNEMIGLIAAATNTEAKAKALLITNKIHGVFTAAHPSPLSAYNGFFGCRHFSKINNFLTENKMAPIDWSK